MFAIQIIFFKVWDLGVKSKFKNLDLSFKSYINKAKKVKSGSSSSGSDSYIQLNDKSFQMAWQLRVSFVKSASYSQQQQFPWTSFQFAGSVKLSVFTKTPNFSPSIIYAISNTDKICPPATSQHIKTNSIEWS